MAVQKFLGKDEMGFVPADFDISEIHRFAAKIPKKFFVFLTGGKNLDFYFCQLFGMV